MLECVVGYEMNEGHKFKYLAKKKVLRLIKTGRTKLVELLPFYIKASIYLYTKNTLNDIPIPFIQAKENEDVEQNLILSIVN